MEQPMKYLLLLLTLPAALTGCGESIESGTPVTSITICTETAEIYSACTGKDVVDIEGSSSLDFRVRMGGDLGTCITTEVPDSVAVVTGDEIEITYRLWYSDGTESEDHTVTFDIDDTAATFNLPCP